MSPTSALTKENLDQGPILIGKFMNKNIFFDQAEKVVQFYEFVTN
jgi:hypothetical protein